MAVVAPSGPVLPQRLRRGVETLRSWGLEVHVMPHVLDATPNRMFAGSDEQRARDFEEAWCLPEVAAVFCARGGHGATRFVDLLDWDRMQRRPASWLVGSSDVTALHQAVNTQLNTVSLYGPMVASEVFAGERPHAPSIAALEKVMFGGLSNMHIDATAPRVWGSGRAEGMLIGGNLALLISAVGTPHSVQARNAIVFLEDVQEPPYRVDRMLTQLLRSGWLDGVRGVAVGTFHDCGDVDEVLRERLTPLGVPIVAGFLVGHGPVQQTIPLGAKVSLDADQGRISVLPVAQS
ncbi:MAG: LD-carboxypeptidase [Candidatus Nanopelagicales bacterium]